MTEPLHGRLKAQAAQQHGLFTRRQAIGCGCIEDEIRRNLHDGTWHRIRRGIYVEGPLWRSMPPIEQYKLEVRAAMMRTADGRMPVVSHWSAAAMLGFELYQPALHSVYLTRPGGPASRSEAGVCHHFARLEPHEMITIDGLAVTSPARTVVDLGREASYDASLVIADQALRRGLDRDTLITQFVSQNQWPGSRSASHVVTDADGRSESVGETLCRKVFAEIGLPQPTLQRSFYRADGSLFARVDFDWEGLLTFAEFDGRQKYYRGLADGEAPGDVVFREKKREDTLHGQHRRESFRVTWSDLYPDARRALRARALDAFARAADRFGLSLPPELR